MGTGLKSNQVSLREMEEKDWIVVHAYASNEIVCKYQPQGPNSEVESKDFVKQVLVDARKEERTRFVFAIIEKEKERMIGAGEFNIRDFKNKTGELGYIVNPDFWGKGIATEVAKLLTLFRRNLHLLYEVK